MKGMSEVVTLLLIVVVGVVIGGWCILQFYLLLGVWFGFMGASIARLLGFDAEFGEGWIIWGALFMGLIGVGIGIFEYAQRRKARSGP